MTAPTPREERPDPQTVAPAPRRIGNVLKRLGVLARASENNHAARMLDLLKPHRPGVCGHPLQTTMRNRDGILAEGRWYECLECLYAWAYYSSRQPTQHGSERGRASAVPLPTEGVVVGKLWQRADVRAAARDIVDSWRLASEGRWPAAFKALQAAETKLMRGPGREAVRNSPDALVGPGADQLHPSTLAELRDKKRMRQMRGEDFGEAALPE